MDLLKVTIVQSDIVWEQPSVNLSNYQRLLKGVGQTDLIVLPEMFATGFSMNPERLSEKINGYSVLWMKNLAKLLNAAVTGTLIIEDNTRFYNRCIWVFPDGNLVFYDKRHLFTMGGEDLHYSAGNDKLLVNFRGWKVCPLICYDLRFPVWSRNTDNYDLLIYMANWPSARHHAWKSLLMARAIENQVYCIGVNRTGIDGAGIQHMGDSGLIDPKGFATFVGATGLVETFKLNYNELHQYRKKFPVLNDRDSFSLYNSSTEVFQENSTHD